MSSLFTNKNGHSLLGNLLSGLLRKGDRSLQAIQEALGNANLVVNFLRGLIEFRPRPDDIFVVSYPRSGTTLMQMLLYQLTTDGKMSFAHISQVSPWFERSLALGTMTASDFDAYSSQRIFKSHLPYWWIPKGARYIYVVRDGMDVLVSYYHLYRSHLAFRGTFDEFFNLFMKGKVQYKSWFRHVAGWRAHQEDPDILFIEYEQLMDSLESCLDTIIDFCKLRIDPDRIPEIVKKCNFEFMKKHEEKFDHITGLLLEKEFVQNSFIRQGKIGVGLEYLNKPQKDLFNRMLQSQTKHPNIDFNISDYLH